LIFQGAGDLGPRLVLDASLEEGKRLDLQSAALLLSEVFAAGLADGPAGRLPRTTLRRLLFDVFHEDMIAFRSYCLEVSGLWSAHGCMSDAEFARVYISCSL
jgi:hypothetical protein